jgi:hypothetical protein
LSAEEAIVRSVERLGSVLANIVLVAPVAMVSAEAKMSGPVIDCPFSLLSRLHLHPGTIQVLCETFGAGQTAN